MTVLLTRWTSSFELTRNPLILLAYVYVYGIRALQDTEVLKLDCMFALIIKMAGAVLF